MTDEEQFIRNELNPPEPTKALIVIDEKDNTQVFTGVIHEANVKYARPRFNFNYSKFQEDILREWQEEEYLKDYYKILRMSHSEREEFVRKFMGVDPASKDPDQQWTTINGRRVKKRR